jgi:Metallo-peptidase family M12/Carboxypeptidase regulatory-like domain
MKKNRFLFLLVSVWLLIGSVSAAVSGDRLWTEISDNALRLAPVQRTDTPDNYRTFRLNKDMLRSILSQAPAEFSRSADPAVIELPMPNGRFERFDFEHSLIVEPELLLKYPELGATYVARGIDDPTATVRFDFLPNGFHAIVLSASGTVLIDPYAAGDTDNYVTYRKDDLIDTGGFKCEVADSSLESFLNENIQNAANALGANRADVASGTQLRTYRLAVAATNEYAAAVGGNTVAGTLAAQVLIMNRVNGVYERDLAIRMVMIGTNNLVIYAADNLSCGGVACTSSNDPYTNSSGSAMLGENTTNLNNVITPANYDIGHVFSTGGGGVATLNGPCGGSKARGVTGLPNPVGDAFAIDYVAHEMGHQWGANHTYNSGGGCAGQRSGGSAYEPGSGVTIMAYAGICGNQNLARNSIDTFHVKSLEVITAFSQTGNGNTCGTATPTGNTPPEVSVAGGVIFDIPKQTPFALTAVATDANGDSLTYDWQQYDLGSSTTAVPNTDADGARPTFRPYLPSTSPTRFFPSLQYILNNANVPPATYNCLGFTCLTGELLPQIGRAMEFQVIVRDNRVNGGGFNTATATVAVDSNSGPFEITSQGTAGTVYLPGSTQDVTWNVNGTTNSPVAAANVRISLSTDGGQTFPTVLADSTPNDGTHAVTLPNITTTTARIKVEAVGKIFFDINNANFSLSNNLPISGRVTSPGGQNLSNLRVTLIDPVGNRRNATTSSFGLYSFDQITPNSSYTLTVSSKRYRFAPQVLNIGTASATNVNLVGLE